MLSRLGVMGMVGAITITGCAAERIKVGGGARQIRGQYDGAQKEFVLPIYGLNFGGEVEATGLDRPVTWYAQLSGFELAPNEKVLPGAEVQGHFFAAEAGLEYPLIKDSQLLNLRGGLEIYYGEYDVEAYVGLFKTTLGDSFIGLGAKPGFGGKVDLPPLLGKTPWRLGWDVYYAFPLTIEDNLADVEPAGWGGGLTLQIPVG